MVDRIRRMNWNSSVAIRPFRRAAVLGALIAGLATLAGCGQKGPLTLPAPPASAASAPSK